MDLSTDSKLKNFISTEDKRYRIVLIILCLIFFFIYSYYSFGSFHKFTSPDETANHFFTKNFINHGTFRLVEPLNEKYQFLVKPRSFSASGGYLLPGSFLGLPLFYGGFGKMLGAGAIYYIGPFVCSISVFVFYLFLKKIFTKKIAFFSCLMLFFQPVFAFYAMRPFLHNGLFLSFLIFSLYLVLKIFEKNKNWIYFLFGLCFALAFSFRSVEIVWQSVLFLMIFIINRKKVKKTGLIWLGLGLMFVLVPLLYYQSLTFGHSLSTAYSSKLIEEISEQPTGGNLAKFIGRLFLPNGFKPGLFLINFYNYTFKLMFPWFTMAFFGIIVFIRSRIKKETNNNQILGYSLLFLLISLWLMFYYGSYQSVDYVDRTSVQIGISYARYWLPVYVFSIPFVMIFLDYFSKKIWPKKSQFITGLILLMVIFQGLYILVFDQFNGIKITQERYLPEMKEKLGFALSHTGEDAIIIAGSSDKIYWPERKVLGYKNVTLSNRLIMALPEISRNVPVFYDADNLLEVNRANIILKNYGLAFTPVVTNYNFYKLTNLDADQ